MIGGAEHRSRWCKRKVGVVSFTARPRERSCLFEGTKPRMDTAFGHAVAVSVSRVVSRYFQSTAIQPLRCYATI